MNHFMERYIRAKEIMKEQDVDALCLFPSADMYYLTGFWTDPLERPLLCILSRLGEPLFIVPKLYEEQVRKTSWIKNVRVWTEGSKMTTQLKESLEDYRLLDADIAIPDRLWLRHYRLLLEVAPKARFKFTSELLGRMRMIKSQQEIELMMKAANLTEEALEAVIPECREGMKEFELAARLEYEMRSKGAEGTAFETIIASGPNSSLPHYSSGDRKIIYDDLVTIDVGARFGRYCSDFTRTVAIGKPNSKMKQIHSIVLKAQKEALNAVRPNVTAEAIDIVAKRIIKEEGYGEYFLHRTGHGVGLDIHELPYISEGNQFKLEPGMTFSIEPGIYLPGEFGVRIEDVVVVTEDGCRPLTKYPADLDVI